MSRSFKILCYRLCSYVINAVLPIIMETRKCLMRNLKVQIGNQHKLRFREVECGEKSKTFKLGKCGQYASFISY